MRDEKKTKKQLIEELAELRKKIGALKASESDRLSLLPSMRKQAGKLSKEGFWESEEPFRSVYEDSPIGIELYDSNGRLLDLNGACLSIFGVSNIADVKGFKLFKDPNVSEEVKKRLKKGETVRYEAPFDFEKVKELKLYRTTKSGVAYLDVLITPLGLEGKKTPTGYLVQVQDITTRKQAEEALQNAKNELEKGVVDRTLELKKSNERLQIELNERNLAEEALRENEKKYKDLVELLPQTVCEIDSRGRFTFINRYGLELFGYSQEDLDKGLYIFDQIVPEDRDQLKERMQIVFSGKALRGGSTES